MHYTAKTFTIPAIHGISPKQIDEHLKLYAGYVTHVNKMYDALAELAQDSEKNGYVMQELRRRLGFEFNGMRLHEYYFGDLEGGMQPINAESKLFEALSTQFGSFEKWLDSFKKTVARGSGWAILNYDPSVRRFHNNWVTNHDEGHLATLPAIIAMDVWEHAYLLDYVPSDKQKYIDAYLNALNWTTISARFEHVHG
jgi:superoxide dismutase, Fe-Mn family